MVTVLNPGTVPALANGRGYAVLVAGRLLGQPQSDAANDEVNNLVGTMTPEEVAAATATPIGAFGRKFRTTAQSAAKRRLRFGETPNALPESNLQ